VVEPEPVSDLVSRSASQVEVGHRAARKGRVENNDSVIQGVGWVVGGESSVTEETFTIAGGETDAVEVECARSSCPKSILHGGLLGGFWSDIVKPPGVQCPGDILQLEVETTSIIVVIQDIDLRLDLGISVADDRNQKIGIGRIDPATYGT
jgi:hypothetical protein